MKMCVSCQMFSYWKMSGMPSEKRELNTLPC